MYGKRRSWSVDWIRGAIFSPKTCPGAPWFLCIVLYSVQYSSYIIFKNRSTPVAIEVHGMTFNAFWASGSILISTIAAIMWTHRKSEKISHFDATYYKYIPGVPVRENTRSTLHCILLQHRFHSLSYAYCISYRPTGRRKTSRNSSRSERHKLQYRYLDNWYLYNGRAIPLEGTSWLYRIMLELLEHTSMTHGDLNDWRLGG